MKKLLKKYMTLKFRIPAIIMLSLLILGASIIGISFKRYEDLNVEKHIKMAEGITNLMADRFDVDKVFVNKIGEALILTPVGELAAAFDRGAAMLTDDFLANGVPASAPSERDEL